MDLDCGYKGNEFARVGVQHETSDHDVRCPAVDSRDQGMTAAFLNPENPAFSWLTGDVPVRKISWVSHLYKTARPKERLTVAEISESTP